MLQRFMQAGKRRLTNAWPVKQVRSTLTQPMATISFDDFPRDAWTTGGALLEHFGARGTYFVSAGFSPAQLARQPAVAGVAGMRYYEPDDIVLAHGRGHEIGCHTLDHVQTPRLGNAEVEQSLQANAAFVRGLIGDTVMTSFAYPQGVVDIRTKRLCARHFVACRGTWPGLNHGMIDLALLKAIALDARFEQQTDLVPLIARARAASAWMVFYGHDVCKSPSPWGSTPRTLERLLSALQREGIEIVTLREGASRLHATSPE